MAIPIYERQGTVRALPDVAVRYAGDGGQAELWEKGKRFMGQVQAKAEEFEDAETLETFNAFRREVEEYHNDPDKGIYNTRLGKDAAEVAGSADTHIDNLIFKYGGGLKTPRARQVFGRMATQERERRYSANMQYEAKQIQAYRDSESDATIQNSLTGIGLNPYDDAAVDAERDRAYMALELKMRGMGEEARIAAMQQLEDQIGGMRVISILREDPFAAEAWFEEHRDTFTPAMQQKVEDAIKQEVDKKIVIGATDQLWGRFGEDEAAARAAIYGSDLDDEQKDKTWARYQARAEDQRRFEKQAETDWYNQWYERLGQASSLEEAVAMIEQSGAAGKHKIDLMGMARQAFAGQGGSAKPEDDLGSYLEAYEKIERGELTDPKKLVQEYGAVLTPDTIKSLSKSIINGNIADENAAAGGDSDIRKIMDRSGIKTPQEQARFRRIYAGEVGKAREEKGRPLTQSEKLVIAENLAKKDIRLEADWWPDGKTYRYVDQDMKQQGYEWSPKIRKWVEYDDQGKVVDILEKTQGSVDVHFSGEAYDPSRTTAEGFAVAQAGVAGDFGKRVDGTQKGQGFFGPIPMTDGSGRVMTEMSIGVEIDGVETEIPLIVPTLTAAEIDALRAGKEPTPEMKQKAVDFAVERKEAGLPYFAEPKERIGLPERKFENLPAGEPPKVGAQSASTSGTKSQLSKHVENDKQMADMSKSSVNAKIKKDEGVVYNESQLAGKLERGTFKSYMPYIFKSEGGYVNDPVDRGGATNLGITQGTLNSAYKKGLVSHNDVKKLTRDEAAAIYKSQYWDTVKGDQLPEGLNYMLFDMAINHGPSGSVKMLQDVLGVKQTGSVNQDTLAAVTAMDTVELINKLEVRRAAKYNRIIANDPKQKKFEHGWANRNRRISEQARKFAQGGALQGGMA